MYVDQVERGAFFLDDGDSDVSQLTGLYVWGGPEGWIPMEMSCAPPKHRNKAALDRL
jgi:hypothetical protein